MASVFIETCVECDSWDIRVELEKTVTVENEITGILETRSYYRYLCRDCDDTWSDYILED